MKKLTTILTIIFFINLLFSSTYYVNVTGSDTTGTGTQTNPWQSFSKAYNTSTNGDTIIFQNGSYLEAGTSVTTTIAIVKMLYIRGEDCTNPQRVNVTLYKSTVNNIFDISNNGGQGGSLGCMGLKGTGPSDNATGIIILRNGLENYTLYNLNFYDLNDSVSNYAIQFESSTTTKNITIFNFSIYNVSDQGVSFAGGGGQRNISIYNFNITMGDGSGTDTPFVITSGSPAAAGGLNISNGIINCDQIGCVTAFSTAFLFQTATLGLGAKDINIFNVSVGSLTNRWIGQVVRCTRCSNISIFNNRFYFNESGVTGRLAFQFDLGNNYILFENNSIGNATAYVDTVTADVFQADAANNTRVCNNELRIYRAEDIIYLNAVTYNVSNIMICANNVTVLNNTNIAHFGCGGEGGDSSKTDTHNCTLKDNNLWFAVNQTNSVHCLFVGSANNSRTYNNTCANSVYGLLSKGNLNWIGENNTLTNITLVSMYDKGSRNAVFSGNMIQAPIGATRATLVDGTGSFYSINTTFFNNTYNITSPTVFFELGTLQANVSSDYNTFYLPSRTYNRSFLNVSTYYWHVAWIDTFGLERHSTFYAPDTSNTSWYDSNWSKCVNITISGGFPTNFTHDIILNSSNFDYASARTDLNDLRFLEGNCYSPNVTMGILPSFNQSVSSGGTSIIKIRTTTENQTTVAMYYSFSGAGPAWNVSGIGIFGDDFLTFNGTNNTDWRVYNNVTVAGGVVDIHNFTSSACSLPACNEIRLNYNISNQTALEFGAIFSNQSSARVGLSDIAFNNQIEVVTNSVVASSAVFQTYNGTGNAQTLTTHSAGWIWGRIEWGTSYYAYYENRSFIFSNGTYMPLTPIRPYFIVANRSVNDMFIDWVVVRKLNTTSNTYSFGSALSPPSTNPITLYLSLPQANETQNQTFTIDITGSGSNFTGFSIGVIYNNTLIYSNSSSSITKTGSLNFTVNPIAPLVRNNQTIMSYSVLFNGTVDYILTGKNGSGTNNITLRFVIQNYNYTILNNFTLEANNSVRLSSGLGALTGNLTLGYYYYPYLCQKGYANGSVMNASCDASLLSTQSVNLFDIITSHAEESGLLYKDTFVNRTYNLSYNLTPESTSSKQVGDQFNATREYFIWLVNSTNGSVNGAKNLSNIYNISFQDESTFARIAIDNAIATYTVTLADGYQKNFSIVYSGINLVNESIVKAYPNFIYINLSSIEVYSKTSYTTRSRFLLGANKTTSEQENVTVYMLPSVSSTLSIINVVDNGEAVSGAYIQILKYYASTQTYINVDQKITNDEGRAQAFLDVDAYYKFIVYDAAGTQLYVSSQPEQFICDSTCQITLNINTASSLDFIGPYTVASCYGVNSTNSIVFNFADYTGLTHNMTFLGYRSGVSTPVCNSTISGSSGGYTCSLSGGENLSQYAYFCQVQHQASPVVVDFRAIIDQRYIQGVVDWILIALVFLMLASTLYLHTGFVVLLVGVVFFCLNLMNIVRFNNETTFSILVISMALSFMFFRKEGG